MWIWLWYVAHCSSPQINAQLKTLKYAWDLYARWKANNLFLFSFHFFSLCFHFFFSVIFHIPFSIVYIVTEMSKMYSHAFACTRENQYGINPQHPNIHTQFFSKTFFSIYQHVCMCSVYQVILLKCGSWPDFIPNGNISQKSCRQSQESGRHLTYSGHGTYQNNSISPVK